MKKTSVLVIAFLCCAGTARSQSNVVGIIDHYGRGFTDENIRFCLPFNERDSLSFIEDDKMFQAAKTGIEFCLSKSSGIHQAEVAFVCCNETDGSWIVYAGMDTVDAPFVENTWTTEAGLPAGITAKYDKLTDLLVEAIQKNATADDKTKGHTLSQYEQARKIQEDFIPFAKQNVQLLRSVIRTSKYPGEREMAVTIIAYYPVKKDIINDLLFALNDPEPAVRAVALGVLAVIADFANANPGEEIHIPAQPFISMLNSISWQDRNKSSLVLLSLTRSRDKGVMADLKSQALKSITDMAGWKNFGHSLPGYILLGRLAGWTDEVIMSAVNNERKAQIEEMLSSIKKSPR